MPASADGFPFLLAAGTAVIAVKPLASAGSGSGHAGAARGTNGEPREERRTIHDPWWGHLRIVASKSCVDLFQKLKADDWGNFNLHDGGRVVQAAGSGVSAPRNNCFGECGGADRRRQLPPDVSDNESR